MDFESTPNHGQISIFSVSWIPDAISKEPPMPTTISLLHTLNETVLRFASYNVSIRLLDDDFRLLYSTEKNTLRHPYARIERAGRALSGTAKDCLEVHVVQDPAKLRPRKIQRATNALGVTVEDYVRILYRNWSPKEIAYSSTGPVLEKDCTDVALVGRSALSLIPKEHGPNPVPFITFVATAKIAS
jgi:hypothetical protein